MSVNIDLNGIHVISQNVNSLNISTRFQLVNNLNRFDQKLESILSKNADIILLQDTRLGTEGSNILKKRLEFHRYGSFTTYTNSNTSSRGVAIIIKNTLPLSVISSFSCPLENYLLLKVLGTPFIIGSVYGPTFTKEPGFLSKLKDDISSLGSFKFLIGGDLNMVSDANILSTTNRFNLDTDHMAQIPNISNSRILSSWVEDGYVVDIFRHLFPDRRIFSHVPFNKLDHSRSRIDHFLCSPDFVGSFVNQSYLALDSTLFDHKCVLLKCVKKSSKHQSLIDPTYLDIPGMKQVTALETLGTLTDYLEPGINREFLLDINLNLVHARPILADIIKIRNETSNFPHDKLLLSVIASKCSKIDELIGPFLDINDHITRRPLTIDHDKFLETLLNNLHNCILAHQRAHKKTMNLTLRDLRKRLDTIQRSNPDLASGLYQEQLKIEKTLLTFDDNITLRNCEKTKLWHTMNFEKPTKAFCLLAKANKGNDSLSQLKKLDLQGNLIEYENNDERNEAICNYFKEIYSKIPNKSLTIDQFLSPEIVNSDHVKSKKLSNLDSARDNIPISHLELTKALNETKLGSSPGLDGFSYAVIKYLWPLIGHPIAKGFEVMVENGKLYDNLRIASIKLIPKKGNSELLKNWRPISLLSNVYKVYSKAFANRLKRIIDLNTSNSQKAYSKSKVIHEALMNIIQCIKKGKNENKKLALLAIDFKKAFDSVSHEYIIEVLKFLNYSDYMLKIVKTTMNGRRAGIMTESGVKSFFDILCGVAQGDSPSGLIFIIVLEPLLWRLALDPSVTHPVFNNEEHIADSSYADDVSILLNGDPENIINCKTILDEFSKLSGLKINVDKTQILPLNVSNDFEDRIRATGFSLVNKLTILGVEISENFELDQTNFNKLFNRIRGMSLFWAKFKLSTVGRINLAKTYLLSQISYFAPILSFSVEQTVMLTNEIGSFIKGKLKIALAKVFEDIKFGGLGMIPICAFIEAMKVNFFKKSLENHDFWAKEVNKFRVSVDFPFHIKTNIIPNTPCSELAICVRKFANAYWSTRSNIIDARIFDNEITCLETNEKLSILHFNHNRTEEEFRAIKRIRVLNLLDTQNNKIFSQRTLFAYLGFELGFLETLYLRSVFNKIARSFNMNELCTPIVFFFGTSTKGSKRMRKILIENRYNICVNKGLAKRGILANSAQLDSARDCNFNSLFGFPKLSHNLRSFFFNFTSYTLYNNAMISHFVQNYESTCKRCEHGGLRPAPKETILHIFWECPCVQGILNDLNDIIASERLNDTSFKEIIFLGCNSGLTYSITTTNIICAATMYFIFSTRNFNTPYNTKKLMKFINRHTDVKLDP